MCVTLTYMGWGKGGWIFLCDTGYRHFAMFILCNEFLQKTEVIGYSEKFIFTNCLNQINVISVHYTVLVKPMFILHNLTLIIFFNYRHRSVEPQGTGNVPSLSAEVHCASASGEQSSVGVRRVTAASRWVSTQRRRRRRRTPPSPHWWINCRPRGERYLSPSSYTHCCFIVS